MRIIKPSVEVLEMTGGSPEKLLSLIEQAGRVCYKSENKIAEGSYDKFIKGIIARGHEAVIEHGVITCKFICDRGVTHELVRHRLASYCQESTRYCNYSSNKFDNEITVIEPCFFERPAEDCLEATDWDVWEYHCETAEKAYLELLAHGCTPQMARTVLPNSLKTEIVVTMNIREWRHFFKLRCAPAAHPQMREIACMGLVELHSLMPLLFEDIYQEVFNND